MIRKTHGIRNLLIVLLCFVAVCLLLIYSVNNKRVQNYAMTIVNSLSNWQVENGNIKWNPLTSSIDFEEVSVKNENSGTDIYSKKGRVSYQLLGFLQAKIVVDKFDAQDVAVKINPPAEKKQKHASWTFNVAKFLFLENLEIKNAQITGISVTLGKSSLLRTETFSFSLRHGLFSKTKLNIAIGNFNYSNNGTVVGEMEKFDLSASTNLRSWEMSFPYVNDINGELSVSNLRFEETTMDSIEAKTSFLDGVLKLSELDISLGKNKLSGTLIADLNSKKFDIEIEIPKPIVLPYIGRRTETINTGGSLSGRIKFSGQGFALSSLSGSGRIDLQHRFNLSPDAPVALLFPIQINSGVIKTDSAQVMAGNDKLAIKGTVDLRGKNMHFEASGEKFPIEHVFDKFTNPHLAKIFGPTDVTGSFDGWGRKFTAKVKGTTYYGGWKPITAEKAETELLCTYDELKLTGQIFSANKITGEADLKIRYGQRISPNLRSKQIEFTGSVNDHPLDESLRAYGLAGLGTGRIKISGPNQSFKGEMNVSASNGSFYKMPFDYIFTKMSIAAKQLVFSDMELKLPKVPAPKLTGNITADISETQTRFRSTPFNGMSIDATYQGKTSKWVIQNISWKNPDNYLENILLSGSYSPTSGSDLKFKGTIDLVNIISLFPTIRSASGIVDVDAAMRGTSASPHLSGQILLDDNSIYLSAIGSDLEHLKGKIRLDGQNIYLEDITSSIDDGEVKVGGRLEMKNMEPSYADIKLSAKAMRYRSEDAYFRMEFDGDLEIAGQFPDPVISGQINILDGKYSKDFLILDTTGKRSKQKPKIVPFDFNPRLNLHVKNSGDLTIENNVGDIWLNINTDIKGTLKNPIFAGIINSTEGKIHYIGSEFDVTSGFIEFRQQYEVPYLEFRAEREITTYNVVIELRGPINNLALNISATSPTGSLEKRDVISLIMFGVTEQDRTAAAAQTGNQLAGTLVGQAIGGFIQQPIMKATGLDVFRLESDPTGTQVVPRVSFGKKLTDRFTVKFATSVSASDAVQSIIGEYLVTDNILLAGERSSDSNYKVSGLLRFRLR